MRLLRRWRSALAVLLPGTLGAAAESVLTGGLFGPLPIVGASVGGALAFVILQVLSVTPESTESSSPAPEFIETPCRRWSTKSADDWIRATRGLTHVAIQRMAESVIGSWLLVEGSVENVHRSSGTYSILVSVTTQGSTAVRMYFAPAWEDQTVTLGIGERILVMGKVDAIHSSVTLTDCELIPVRY